MATVLGRHRGWLPHSYLFDAWYEPLRYEGLINDGRITGYRLESVGGHLYAEADRIRCPINPELHAFVTPNPIAIVSPGDGTRITITADPGTVIEARAAHIDPAADILWLLDRVVIGRTFETHEIALTVTSGAHELVVQDESGNSAFVVFEVEAAATE